MPVFGTIASKFNDDGVTALYHALLDPSRKTGVAFESTFPGPIPRSPPPRPSSSRRSAPATWRKSPKRSALSPRTETQADALRRVWHLEETRQPWASDGIDDTARPCW
jgi:methylmalonyl-CoA mutase